MLKIFIILLEIIEKSDFACPYVPSHVIIIIRGSMETYFTEGHPIGRVILSNRKARRQYLCLLYFNYTQYYPSISSQSIAECLYGLDYVCEQQSSIQLCVSALMNYCLRLQPMPSVRCNSQTLFKPTHNCRIGRNKQHCQRQQMSMEINLHLS